MRKVPLFTFAAVAVFTAPAHAELPDCATFPNDRARFACYDAISRMPKPEPKETVKPQAGETRPSAMRSRKAARPD